MFQYKNLRNTLKATKKVSLKQSVKAIATQRQAVKQENLEDKNEKKNNCMDTSSEKWDCTGEDLLMAKKWKSQERNWMSFNISTK